MSQTREENPECNNGCKGKTLRCSVIMSKDTLPENAEFVEDGVAYGMTYFFCRPCVKKDGRPLKVWKD